MARSRELYMDINVAGRNFERSNEILTLKPENTIEVLDAYFAEAEIKKVYEGKEENYTVKSGDTLERIATKKGTTVEAIIESDPNITEQNKSSIQIGQKITFSSQTEKGENITFKRLSKASIGKEVYIVIKTKDFENEVLKINVKQGKEEGILAQNEAIPLSIKDERKVAIEATAGNLCSTDYLNKDNYSNMAIIKVSLDPANEDDLESWQDKLKELENKKTFLYLLVDAHSNNTDKEVIYHGRNPDADGKPDTDSMKNHWLDMETKWFEIQGGCYCNRDMTKEEVKKLIDKERLFTHSKCPLLENQKTFKEFTKYLNKAFSNYDINTCLRKAHFIAQIEAESDHFNTTIEYASGEDYDSFTHNSDYNKYKNYLADKEKYKKYNTSSIKRGYLRYKECISHGHKTKGDGRKYKGKGLIQLTWKDTYESYFKYLDKGEWISKPEKVAKELKYSFDSAGWYWSNGSAWGDMNPKADSDDLIAISIGINGGLNGYEHRKKNLKKILKTMEVKEKCSSIHQDLAIGTYKYETSVIKNSNYGKRHKTKIQEYDD